MHPCVSYTGFINYFPAPVPRQRKAVLFGFCYPIIIYQHANLRNEKRESQRKKGTVGLGLKEGPGTSTVRDGVEQEDWMLMVLQSQVSATAVAWDVFPGW